MSCPDALSELVTRARRHRLSQAEQGRLDGHLSVCVGCRRERQIGADFDAMGGLWRGDDKLIAMIADRTIERPDRRRESRRRLQSLSMTAALACVLFSAGAGAGALWHARAPSPVLQSESSAPDVHAAPEHPFPTVTSPSQGAQASLPSTFARSVSSHPNAQRPALAAVLPATAPAIETADETASSLFASANRERRQAHVAAATLLYDELQRRHPGSGEARVSHVSLGRLLLDRGEWSGAKSQFEQYSTTSPDGLLAPEALFGKALALQALGRRDEELAAWTALLARFADSVYASHARHRVEELR
jgi:TolA-binding protein